MELSLRQARPQRAMGSLPYRHWLLPDGSLWLEFYRSSAGYLLRFPGLGDFEITADGLAVTCHPAPGVTEDTSRHLFLNQVSPLILSRQGMLVFHGSAVEIAGVAVAFIGESGRGKSTLAASFATGGYGFLTDDGLIVEESANGFLALPGHPSLRLWQDSEEAILAAETETALPAQYTDKVRFLVGEHIAACDQPRPLRRVYFLGDGNAPEVVIQPIGAADAVAQWLAHAFMLETDERSLLASHFERLTALAVQVGAFRLDFPRRFDMLDAVKQAIVADVLNGAGAA